MENVSAERAAYQTRNRDGENPYFHSQVGRQGQQHAARRVISHGTRGRRSQPGIVTMI